MSNIFNIFYKEINKLFLVLRIKVHSLSKLIYKHSYKFFSVLWSLFSALLFIRFNYFNCILDKDYTKEFHKAEYIIFLLFAFIMAHMAYHVFKYRNDDKAMNDENPSNQALVPSSGKIKYFVVPLFAVWVFSFGQIVVLAYHVSTNGFWSSVEHGGLHNFLLWPVLFFAFLYNWTRQKNKAEKIWDVAITITVSLVVLIQILWSSYLSPFMYGIIDVGECVSCEISKNHTIRRYHDNNNTDLGLEIKQINCANYSEFDMYRRIENSNIITSTRSE